MSPAGMRRVCRGVSPVRSPHSIRLDPGFRASSPAQNRSTPAPLLGESSPLHGHWAVKIPGDPRRGIREGRSGSARPMHWCLRVVLARDGRRDAVGIEGEGIWARRVRGAVRSCVSWSAHRFRPVMRCARAVSRISRRRFPRTDFERADTRSSRVEPGRARCGAARSPAPPRSTPSAQPLRSPQPLSSSFAIARIWISSVPA